jgi:hypothetical protein
MYVNHGYKRLGLGLAMALALVLVFYTDNAEGKQVEFHVKPSMTDSSIIRADAPHVIMYNSEAKSSKVLVFLSGTESETGPIEFYRTVVSMGYRLIVLSYIDTPTVPHVCTLKEGDPTCAENFRRKRCFGNDLIGLIADTPADSIVNRVTKLLEYLKRTDPQGGWGSYSSSGGLNWSLIAVAGQGQGGGMAAFIAKNHPVARVMMFSGGWDHGGSAGKIASWYKVPGVTSPDRWFATYHFLEADAKTMIEVYRALEIPETNILILHERVPKGRRAHPQIFTNRLYRAQWVRMLGSGTQ